MSTKDCFIAVCPHCRREFKAAEADGLAYFLRQHAKRVHKAIMTEDESLEAVRPIQAEASVAS